VGEILTREFRKIDKNEKGIQKEKGVREFALRALNSSTRLCCWLTMWILGYCGSVVEMERLKGNGKF